MGAKPSIVKAAGRGDIARVQHLVRKRGKIVLKQKAPGGWTALHKAARNGRVDVVMFLIESSADVDALDASMSTPLHCACWKGHTKVATILIAKGANATAVTESGWTALHSAAFRGHAETCSALLATGALSPAQRDLMGFTPLELVDDPNSAVADVLERHGFGVASPPRRGAAFWQAAVQGAIDEDGEDSGEVARAMQRAVDVHGMLGLRADAPPSEVRAAYKRLAGKYRVRRPRAPARAPAPEPALKPASEVAAPEEVDALIDDGPAAESVAAAPPETPEARAERMVGELVRRGFPEEQARSALARVGFDGLHLAEELLRSWGLAPKKKGLFMRKWKGKPGPGQGSVVQAAAAAGTEELLEHIAEAASAGEHEATGGHGRHSAMSFASESSLAPASTRASRPSRALESARQSAAEREGERAAFLKAEMEGRLPRGTVAALAAGWDGASSVGEPAQAPASHEGWGAFDLAFLKTLCPPGWRAYRSSTTQMIYWMEKASKTTTWIPPAGHIRLDEAAEAHARWLRDGAPRAQSAAPSEARTSVAPTPALDAPTSFAPTPALDPPPSAPTSSTEQPPLDPQEVRKRALGGLAQRFLSAEPRRPAATGGVMGGGGPAARRPEAAEQDAQEEERFALLRTFQARGPMDEAGLRELRAAAPAGWRVYVSKSTGQPYWFDKARNVTSWVPPAGAARSRSGDSGGQRGVGDGAEGGAGRGGVEAGGAAEAGGREAEEAGPSDEAEHRPQEAREEHAAGSPAADAAAGAAGAAELPLPSDWREYVSKSTGKVYYFHKPSKTTSWVRPTREGPMPGEGSAGG